MNLPTKPTRDSNGLVLTVLTLIGIYLCYRLALPFLPAIVWALTLAVIFTPFQRHLEKRFGHPNTGHGDLGCGHRSHRGACPPPLW